MLNTIRADFYRLFKTRGFWITQIIIFLFIILMVTSKSAGNIGVMTKDAEQQIQEFSSLAWTGVESVGVLQAKGEYFLYFILPLLVFVVGYDFSKNTYKNILTIGVSRSNYYFSKIISFIIMLLFQMLAIYTILFFIASVLNGTGEITSIFIINALRTLLRQSLFVTSVSIFSSLILFSTKNNTISVIVTLILPAVIAVLHYFNQDIKIYESLNFIGGLQNVPKLAFSLRDPSVIGAFSVIIFGSILITQIFKSQEL